jgi:hypothetical protein
MSGNERGQVLPIMLMFTVTFLGMVGFVIDYGHVYACFHELQASSDAAALAGAYALPNSTAVAEATSYSSVGAGLNATSLTTGAVMSAGFPLVRCLNALKNQGEACVAPANGNAITVKQQLAVPMWFARLFGVNTVTISAASTAAMRGSTAAPYNVAIIIDTTASMGTNGGDTCTYNGVSGNTRLACAKFGVQALLSTLSPCAATYSTCTVSGGVATSPVDQVALFTFPNVTPTTAPNDYTVPCSDPSIPVYSFPIAGSKTYTTTGAAATYQITPFLSDYRASDTASALTTSSDLSATMGLKSGCGGMGAPGGDGTYFAGSIYAAQAALTAQQALNTTTQNVLIILSDGAANSTKFASKDVNGGSLNSNGVYPSTIDQCHQAITAAAAATAAGTRVYSIAYGASTATSGQCTSDTPGISPCSTMTQLASAPQYFYSDTTAIGGDAACTSVQTVSGLSSIFTQIGGDLTVARLIPDNTQ